MKRKNTVPITMLFIFLLSTLTCCTGLYFYQKTELEWIRTINIISGSVSAHFLIMYISTPIVFILFRNRYNYNSFWFRPKAFEKTLYTFLKVKKWKKKLPAYDRKEYSFHFYKIETVIQNMCHAEVVHEVIAVASYLPVLFGFVISNYGLLLLLSMCFSGIHLLFVFIQRYNRPRLINLYKKAETRY